jgi:hypothetical protein
MYRLSLAALLLPACVFEKAADEGPYCEDQPSDVALEDATDLGFSAADVLAGIPAEEAVVFTYADGSATELSLAFTPAGTARFVTSEAVYPDSGGESPAIGVVCDDRVELDGRLSFHTADGAFAELLDVVVAATAERVFVNEELALDALFGTFDITPFVQSTDYDALKAWLDISFADGASAGAVSGQASGEDECEAGDACSAWAENVAVGSWPAGE